LVRVMGNRPPLWVGAGTLRCACPGGRSRLRFFCWARREGRRSNNRRTHRGAAFWLAAVTVWVGSISGQLKRKKENRQPKGGMGGRHVGGSSGRINCCLLKIAVWKIQKTEEQRAPWREPKILPPSVDTDHTRVGQGGSQLSTRACTTERQRSALPSSQSAKGRLLACAI